MRNELPHALAHKATGKYSAMFLDVLVVGHKIMYRRIAASKVWRVVAVHIIAKLEDVDNPAFLCCNPWYVMRWGVEVLVCNPRGPRHRVAQ